MHALADTIEFLGYEKMLDGPIELVWNPIAQSMHQLIDGVVLGPELARVPFRVAGRCEFGFVVEAVINTTQKRVLIHPGTKEDVLSFLQPTRHFQKFLTLLFSRLQDLPPTPYFTGLGFHSKGWGGAMSPNFVDVDFWTPVSNKIPDASKWLDMERCGGESESKRRWGRFMYALRHALIAPEKAPFVINAIGQHDSLCLASALLTVATGQAVIFSDPPAPTPFHFLSQTGAVQPGLVIDGSLKKPGWGVGVFDFENAPSRAQLLRSWCDEPLETEMFRSVATPAPRLVVFSETDITAPSRPGRAGSVWDSLSPGVPVWSLPPAPPAREIVTWIEEFSPYCAAADIAFQKLTN